MSLCLSSFWVVWLHRHKFSLSPSLHASGPPSLFLWHARQANPPLSTCSCSVFANFPLSFSHSPKPRSFIFLYIPSVSSCLGMASHHLSVSPCHFFLFTVQTNTTFPPSVIFLFSFPPTPSPPYRWRLTGECSTIRRRDCLLLRRWMEAPSASPTQPQLHQPP